MDDGSDCFCGEEGADEDGSVGLEAGLMTQWNDRPSEPWKCLSTGFVLHAWMTGSNFQHFQWYGLPQVGVKNPINHLCRRGLVPIFFTGRKQVVQPRQRHQASEHRAFVTAEYEIDIVSLSPGDF